MLLRSNREFSLSYARSGTTIIIHLQTDNVLHWHLIQRADNTSLTTRHHNMGIDYFACGGTITPRFSEVFLSPNYSPPHQTHSKPSELQTNLPPTGKPLYHPTFPYPLTLLQIGRFPIWGRCRRRRGLYVPLS